MNYKFAGLKSPKTNAPIRTWLARTNMRDILLQAPKTEPVHIAPRRPERHTVFYELGPVDVWLCRHLGMATSTSLDETSARAPQHGDIMVISWNIRENERNYMIRLFSPGCIAEWKQQRGFRPAEDLQSLQDDSTDPALPHAA